MCTVGDSDHHPLDVDIAVVMSAVSRAFLTAHRGIIRPTAPPHPFDVPDVRNLRRGQREHSLQTGT